MQYSLNRCFLTIICVSSLSMNFQKSSVYFSLLYHFSEACAETHTSGNQTFVMSLRELNLAQVSDNSPSQVSYLPSETTLLLLYAPYQTCACTTVSAGS